MESHDAAEPVKTLFRVRVVKMSDGERLPLVIDQRGLPLNTLMQSFCITTRSDNRTLLP